MVERIFRLLLCAYGVKNKKGLRPVPSYFTEYSEN